MKEKFICVNCGCQEYPKTMTNGSIFIELFLWCFFIIPGVIYSLWRLTTRYKACPLCRVPNMISLASPRGKQLLGAFQKSE